MAAGTETTFKIYHEEYYSGMNEVMQQNANAFNGAGGNAIQLRPRLLKGDFEKEAFFSEISGLVAHRDPQSVAAVADTDMAAAELVGVKIPRKIIPIGKTISSWKKIAEDPREMSFLLGQQAGQAQLVDYLNTSLICLQTAIADNAAALFDYTATGTLAPAALNSGLAKFGDAAQRVVAWVMHSKSYFDLVGTALTNNLFGEIGIVIYGGLPGTFGRPVIVTDSDALITTGTPDVYHTLGLVSGACMIDQSEEEEVAFERVTGLENLVYRYQAEYAYNIKLKGLTYSTAAGANPTDATLGNAANWSLIASDIKATAGICINTD